MRNDLYFVRIVFDLYFPLCVFIAYGTVLYKPYEKSACWDCSLSALHPVVLPCPIGPFCSLDSFDNIHTYIHVANIHTYMTICVALNSWQSSCFYLQSAGIVGVSPLPCSFIVLFGSVKKASNLTGWRCSFIGWAGQKNLNVWTLHFSLLSLTSD